VRYVRAMFARRPRPSSSAVVRRAVVLSSTLIALAMGLLLPVSAANAGTATLAPWHPMRQQEADADTLYFLNAGQAEKMAPGQGGFIEDQGGINPFPGSLQVVPGRFTAGVTNVGLVDPGDNYMPVEGMISGDQFTIEMWVKSAVPWSSLSSQVPFAISDAVSSDGLYISIGGGSVGVQLQQAQDGTSTDADVSAPEHLSGSGWNELAVTYASGVLRLYLDGKEVASKSRVSAPLVWSDTGHGDGIQLLSSSYGVTKDLTLSDLRISDVARVPGQSAPVITPTVSINRASTAGAAVTQGLLGSLHSVNTLTDFAPEPVEGHLVTTVRTDKMLDVTPIKIGAPDATHPTPGISGDYSYDWQVVDRTVDSIESDGATPYLSIDATPSLLGGQYGPSSGTTLTSGHSSSAPFSPQVPNNLTSYATMVRDLVYRVVVQDHVNVPRWGVWNEPDTTAFWLGSVQQYIQMYAAVAAAVKSVSPSLQVGGPEVASVDTPFFTDFLRAVVEQKLPLDFISFHDYSGSLGDLFHARDTIDSIFKGTGRAPPPILVGEWDYSLADKPGFIYPPWNAMDVFANDWGAAYDAASLIDMQQIGAENAILTFGRDTPAGPFGLIEGNEPLVTLNVYKMWTMLAGSRVLPTSGYPGAGVTLQASRGAGGRLYVLVSHLRYQKNLDAHLTLHLSGVARNAAVTRYEIDDQHSDLVDAGVSHAALETVPAPRVRHGSLSVTLPSRAVALLVIG
jgi:hypothetical protein